VGLALFRTRKVASSTLHESCHFALALRFRCLFALTFLCDAGITVLRDAGANRELSCNLVFFIMGGAKIELPCQNVESDNTFTKR
jgi:hypothetical protein